MTTDELWAMEENSWWDLWDAHNLNQLHVCTECKRKVTNAIEARVRAERDAEMWSSVPNENYINGILAGPQVRALVGAAQGLDAFIQMVDSGMTVFPFDPEHEDSEPKVYERVLARFRAALAPFEGSAGE